MTPRVPPHDAQTEIRPSAAELIETLLTSTGKRSQRRALDLLEQLPADDAVPALAAALREARTKRTFQLFATLLADYPCQEAVDELARHARENKRFPRIPLRALGHCGHPAAVKVLLQFMESGRAKQQRTAMTALVQQNSVASFGPLCRMALNGNDELKREALRMLQTMGRAGTLARRALQDTRVSDAACASILLALAVLPVYVFPLSFSHFDAERFLGHMARRKWHWRERAESVLRHVRDQQTLLRPADGGERDVLLRMASGPGESRPEELLRAAFAPATGVPRAVGAWWRKLFRRR